MARRVTGVRVYSNAAEVAAHELGVRAAVTDEAIKIGTRATLRLAAHRDTGHAEIEVSKGTKGVDSFVSLVDDAAMSIEFGHRHNRSGEFVRGLYIITGAAGLA